MQDYLIPGREYLAARPGFELLGRDEELSKLCSILVRKFSNSVIMCSPSGVGATSLCMGLEALKSNPAAPFDIISKTIFWLDSNGMFGTGDTAHVEAAFRAALARLASIPGSLLIVEDAGDFLDGCRNCGTLHFVNMLNAEISKGNIQVILETSDTDLDKVLKWHSDLREYYTIMDVPEPAGHNLEVIVKAAAVKLQKAHDVRIDDEAILTAIELTQKYRANDVSAYAQPKRSITLLDRAMASYRLAAHAMPPAAQALKARVDAGTATAEQLQSYHAIMAQHSERQARMMKFQRDQRDAEEMIRHLEEEADKLEREAAARREAGTPEAPVSANQTAFMSMASRLGASSSELVNNQNKLADWRRLLIQHRENFAALEHTINEDLHLDRTAVLIEFSKISKISVSKLGEDELLILRELEPQLKRSIFGQDHAVEKVANAIKVARVGRRNKDRPLASFLLPGPSGVGKTEIAKQVARALLGDQKALTRFDMAEYMERHAVSKLIGAPPGYEGFEAGGILTNAMRTNRNRVILFDEIEKAHPDVFNIFLSILDDGRLTDNIGRVVEFSDSIIIMTTNIGQPHFLNDAFGYDETMDHVIDELGQHFRPEFLNRFNGRENLIGFKKLELPSIERIVAREIGDLAQAYTAHGVTVNVPADVISTFCQHKYNPITGARGLPGFINSNLEPRIVNALLDGNARPGSVFNVGYDIAGSTFTIETSAGYGQAA